MRTIADPSGAGVPHGIHGAPMRKTAIPTDFGRRCLRTAYVAVIGCVMAMNAQAARDAESLSEMSLAELSDLEVTSVSKSSELLRLAPASIYVITHDEIMRSGVTSVAEALRLAPNLQISQYASNTYIAGARGLAGAQELQNFSNKLLILIDGRSVYSPLYSGVYLDVQDVLLEDIDRIEVISGPGATLWGANAMHGVINVITRPAYLTDGAFVAVGSGNFENNVSARYGRKVSDALSYRVYAKAFERDAMELADGSSAQDDWNKLQGGFRVDWTGPDDTFTGQGDLYRGDVGQLGIGDQHIEGANLLGRWQRRTARGEWQVQGYFDYSEREQPPGGVAFELETLDLELQHRSELGAHRLVWGAGARFHWYEITNSASLLFEPNERTLELANVFVQDTFALSDSIDLTLGIKAEHDSFSGWNPLPDARIAWRPDDQSLWWAAASRAIRSPTPFDQDVIEVVGTTTFLTGNRSFEPEKVDAFEIGYRSQHSPNFSLSMSVFYNRYDDLRTIEPASSTQFLPLKWDNLMEGQTYGFEAWAKWQVTDSWRLSPGVRLLTKDLKFSRGASALIGLEQSGNDPRSQALLTSSLNVTPNLTFDATLRYVDALPEPALDSYYELNASLGWHRWRQLDLTLTGFNLLDSRHLEYPAPSGEYIGRSIFAQARWRF
jgi:iron complex outermembrane receptor protein